MGLEFRQAVINRANALSGQTVTLILLTSSATDAGATSVATLVANEIASVAGYTTRPQFTLTAANIGAWDTVSNSILITIPGSALTVTAGASPINYQNYALITGGTSALGNTTGSLLWFEPTGSAQTIAANTQVQFAWTHRMMRSNNTSGIA